MKRLLLLASLVFSGVSFAENENELYEKFSNVESPFGFKNESQYQLVYFFNLNCPACHNFNHFIEAWSKDKPSHVEIHYAPYEPFKSWKWANIAYKVVESRRDDFNPFEATRKLIESEIGPIDNFQEAQEYISKFTQVDRGNIMKAMYSTELIETFNSAEKLANNLNVTGTPTLGLITKSGVAYKISPESGISMPTMLRIVDALVQYHDQIQKEKQL
ncbi:thioredoxin domain-containing protein [Vibrio alginolyticus]|uniref:thioredoxin domain-containing protein n=1 Tax=Vibrio alginolyticus TaxID=663 RepID=UPI0006CAA370|nr:thioredoxin domain-containing protein [Vibrio alginolyticus]KPM98484.1 hypothetical protein AOG25_08550 [Vibrio alginolyticus]CAH7144147.1 Thioredoxin-like_fold domain-containing protein [Vibrio chagasii]CAH7235095.1 Thioredoxin-like_fold domain-containing protein [Vibrio chagasii]